MTRILSLFVLIFTILGLASLISAQSLTPMEELGKKIYFDKIADPDRMACADCHEPRAGFTGPIPGINNKGSVYRGAVPQRFGNRKPPSAAYATVSPNFYYNAAEELFMGGNFWDGRATGDYLGNPAADQALGPFLNPVEQNNASEVEVLEQIASSKYYDLWIDVWGEEIDFNNVIEEYKKIGWAIEAFEDSREVNQFSSKFDYFYENLLAASMDVTAIDMSNMADYYGKGLSNYEVEGLALFNDENKGMCSLCHTMDTNPPLFTDFSFDNLGIPKNPQNPFYDMDEVFLDDGSPINPEGENWIDPGLGGFLETLNESYFSGLGLIKADEVAGNMGKHKVPTLRNVDKRPDIDFIKAYGHNGFFKSLEDIVHFYNTRDVEMWPPPEVAANVNTDELGNLGLTPAEEAAIVAFMKTLSDGYYDPWADKQALPMEASLTVSEFELSQNYPNPFNPQTTISFNLKQASEVTLTVYNALGEEVVTLISNSLPAGAHSVIWDAASYTSGIYFYRLQADGFTQMKKMVLMK